MKLYVCHGTFRSAPRPGGHPCGQAHKALEEAGHAPEVILTRGWAALPKFLNPGRRRVTEISGNPWVPTLELDDGTVVDGSKEIIAWAKAHPADAAAA